MEEFIGLVTQIAKKSADRNEVLNAGLSIIRLKSEIFPQIAEEVIAKLKNCYTHCFNSFFYQIGQSSPGLLPEIEKEIPRFILNSENNGLFFMGLKSCCDRLSPETILGIVKAVRIKISQENKKQHDMKEIVETAEAFHRHFGYVEQMYDDLEFIIQQNNIYIEFFEKLAEFLLEKRPESVAMIIEALIAKFKTTDDDKKISFLEGKINAHVPERWGEVVFPLIKNCIKECLKNTHSNFDPQQSISNWLSTIQKKPEFAKELAADLVQWINDDTFRPEYNPQWIESQRKNLGQTKSLIKGMQTADNPYPFQHQFLLNQIATGFGELAEITPEVISDEKLYTHLYQHYHEALIWASEWVNKLDYNQVPHIIEKFTKEIAQSDVFFLAEFADFMEFVLVDCVFDRRPGLLNEIEVYSWHNKILRTIEESNMNHKLMTLLEEDKALPPLLNALNLIKQAKANRSQQAVIETTLSCNKKTEPQAFLPEEVAHIVGQFLYNKLGTPDKRREQSKTLDQIRKMSEKSSNISAR